MRATMSTPQKPQRCKGSRLGIFPSLRDLIGTRRRRISVEEKKGGGNDEDDQRIDYERSELWGIEVWMRALKPNWLAEIRE